MRTKIHSKLPILEYCFTPSPESSHLEYLISRQAQNPVVKEILSIGKHSGEGATETISTRKYRDEGVTETISTGKHTGEGALESIPTGKHTGESASETDIGHLVQYLVLFVPFT